MPQFVEDLVSKLLKDKSFYPEKGSEDRRSTAWAVATSIYNKKKHKKRSEKLNFLVKTAKDLDINLKFDKSDKIDIILLKMASEYTDSIEGDSNKEELTDMHLHGYSKATIWAKLREIYLDLVENYSPDVIKSLNIQEALDKYAPQHVPNPATDGDSSFVYFSDGSTILWDWDNGDFGKNRQYSYPYSKYDPLFWD